MAKVTITNLLWDGRPTPDDEAWYIESEVERLKEKWPPESDPWRSGFERRSNQDSAEVLGKLAVLQTRYYATDDRDEIARLGRHAMLLLIPLIGRGQKRLCQYTGQPCNKMRDARTRLDGQGQQQGQDIVRCELRRARYLLAWQILNQHALKLGPPIRSGYSWPILTVRERMRSEIWEDLRGETAEDRRSRKETIIGMAVLRAYKAQDNGAKKSIDAAFFEIAAQGVVDGETTGGEHNVEKLYKGYRRKAFARGFADERSFWALYYDEPLPDDQLWLSDFPENTGG